MENLKTDWMVVTQKKQIDMDQTDPKKDKASKKNKDAKKDSKKKNYIKG